MIVFIENLTGVQIVSSSNELLAQWSIKVVGSNLFPWIGNALSGNGPVVVASRGVIRWLKLGASLLQLPVIQQDPLSMAFRFNLWRRVLSDGLLTEYLVEVLRVRVGKMYSISSAINGSSPVVSDCAIIGSNWLEFGMMTEASYLCHLAYLSRLYPTANYYCHPKERSSNPEKVFGVTRVVRPSEPIEGYLRKKGVPCQLVGVCSTSLLALAIGNDAPVAVDLIRISLGNFDGRTADIVESLRRPIRGVRKISVDDLQRFLLAKLQARNVPVNLIEQPCHDKHHH